MEKKNAKGKKQRKGASGGPSKAAVRTGGSHMVKYLWKFLSVKGKLQLLAFDATPSPEQKADVRREFIPFYKALLGDGTQNPSMWVAMTPLVITTSAATVNQQTYGVAANGFTSSTAFSLLFDEVRFLCVRFRYDANLTGSNLTNGPTGLSVAVIDYDDAAVIASYNSGVSYDSRKIYQLAPPSEKHQIWTAIPDFVPDQQWYDTAASTVVLYWKNFTSAQHGLGAQSQVGILSVEALVQFRQFRN